MNIDFSNYDYNKVYNCCDFIKCHSFNKLMYLITNSLNDRISLTVGALMDYIINNPTEINEKNQNGLTPLMLSAVNLDKDDNPKIVKLLVDRGADVNARDIDGLTTLMIVPQHLVNLDTVKLLLEHNADINAIDTSGATALSYALYWSHIYNNLDTVKLLLDNGADANLDVNVKDYGDTMLMLAARRDDFNLIKLLLNYGADPYILNNKGKCLFDYLKGKMLLDCHKFICDFESQKKCYKKVLKQIPLQCSKIIYHPDSLRTKLLSLKFTLNHKTMSYDDVKTNYPDVLDHLDIIDIVFEMKINDFIKYI